eukprot:g728.t1
MESCPFEASQEYSQERPTLPPHPHVMPRLTLGKIGRIQTDRTK